MHIIDEVACFDPALGQSLSIIARTVEGNKFFPRTTRHNWFSPTRRRQRQESSGTIWFFSPGEKKDVENPQEKCKSLPWILLHRSFHSSSGVVRLARPIRFRVFHIFLKGCFFLFFWGVNLTFPMAYSVGFGLWASEQAAEKGGLLRLGALLTRWNPCSANRTWVAWRSAEWSDDPWHYRRSSSWAHLFGHGYAWRICCRTPASRPWRCPRRPWLGWSGTDARTGSTEIQRTS